MMIHYHRICPSPARARRRRCAATAARSSLTSPPGEAAGFQLARQARRRRLGDIRVCSAGAAGVTVAVRARERTGCQSDPPAKAGFAPPWPAPGPGTRTAPRWPVPVRLPLTWRPSPAVPAVVAGLWASKSAALPLQFDFLSCAVRAGARIQTREFCVCVWWPGDGGGPLVKGSIAIKGGVASRPIRPECAQSAPATRRPHH